MEPESPTLEGQFVRLEPLSPSHRDGFVLAGAEWGMTREFARDGIAASLRRRDEGTAIPFAAVDRRTGRVAGGTSLLRIDPENRRLEIGSTWLGAPWRRTAINTESKLLLLGHAFGALGCARVEFRIDADNAASRAVVLRIGAVEEGTLRAYKIDAAGRPRDVVVSSILDSEWPATETRLKALLDRRT